MSYILIVAGLLISASNLLSVLRYFNGRKAGSIPPFVGGVCLMLGMNFLHPATIRFWYLFLMLDVSFYVWPYLMGKSMWKHIRRNK